MTPPQKPTYQESYALPTEIPTDYDALRDYEKLLPIITRTKNPAAVSLGRKGGSVKSQRKSAACRANGLKNAERIRKAREISLNPSSAQITPNSHEKTSD